MQTLPDKGKKIKEFAEKVRLALEHHGEEERRPSLVSAARTELQSKYQQAFTMQQHAVPAQEAKTSPASADGHQNNKTVEEFVSRAAAGETMETSAAGSSLNSDETKEGDLVEALGRVRLSETSSGFSSESKETLNSAARDNYFFKEHIPKKPHYVTVLEKSERTSPSRRQKFKPNQ